MDFKLFLEKLPKLAQSQLFGEVAHKQMTLSDRDERVRVAKNNNNPKNAAVLILLYPKAGQTYFVLTLRSKNTGVHSSQISLPGGKYEQSDFNYENTALRETFEEIGVRQAKIEIIKPFSELYVVASNFVVHPFLGVCKDEIDFYANKNEVSKIIEVPVSKIFDNTINIDVEITLYDGKKAMTPAFKIEDYIVWGATAMIINEFKMAFDCLTD